MFTFFILDWYCPFRENLDQEIKSSSLSRNLVPTLILKLCQLIKISMGTIVKLSFFFRSPCGIELQSLAQNHEKCHNHYPVELWYPNQNRLTTFFYF